MITIFFDHAPLYAIETIELQNSEASRYRIGPSFEYFEDKTAQLTIGDVSSPSMSNRFVAAKTDNPRFGYTSSAYWLRFRLKNVSIDTTDYLLEVGYPVIDFVDLYIETPDGSKVMKNGTHIPFSQREFKARALVFPIKLDLNRKYTFYMRCKTITSMSFPLEVMSQTAFRLKAENEILFYGAYFGIIIVMILYNAFIYLSTKESSYLYYITFLSFWGVEQFLVTGLAQMYLVNDYNQLMNLLQISGLGFFCFIILFTMRFLRTDIYASSLNNIFRILLIFNCLLFVYLKIRGLNFLPIANFILFIIATLALISGIVTYLNGNKSVRFFLMAWSFLLTSLIILVLRLAGFLPANIFFNNVQYIGSTIEMVLLSLALADRMNIMKTEFIEYRRKTVIELARYQRAASIHPHAVDGSAKDIVDVEDLPKPSRGAKILIMDDNELLLDNIPTALSGNGYIVEIARNGHEAIDMYKEAVWTRHPFDLVILDVIIPGGMSGIAAMKLLSAFDPKVCAIISSAYGESTIIDNFRQYGFAAALPKPYTIAELLHVITSTLNDRDTFRQK